MKLTDVIKIWEILHVKDTGDLGFCDLEKAIDKTVGVENDVPGCQPSSGWRNIQHTPAEPDCNCSGTCPECVQKDGANGDECDACDGIGVVSGNGHDDDPCPKCDGEGVLLMESPPMRF